MNIIQKKNTEEEIKAAFNKGYQAGKKGLHPMLNPYGIGNMELFGAWSDGHDKGMAEMEEEK